MPRSLRSPWLVAAIVAVGAFWCASIRAGTPWGDDWAMYVRHAVNLASGTAYDDTRFIGNPHFPTYAPRIYPPGLPLMLLPIYRAFGIDLTALKAPVILSFVLALGAAALYYGRELSRLAVLLLVLGVGFNPVNWELKDYIVADFPFMLAVLLCAWMIDTYYTPGRGGAGHAALIGLGIYAAYAMRTLGILWLPALLVHDLLARRTVTKRFGIVAATFLALALAQLLVVPWDASYLEMLAYYRDLSPREIWSHVMGRAALYRVASWDLWTMEQARPAWLRVYSDVLFVLAAAGLVKRMVTRLSAVELFVVGYLLTIFVFPGFQGVRFLTPLLPFVFAYVLGPLDGVDRPAARFALLAVLAIPLGWSYGSFYGTAPWSRSPAGAHMEAAQALFRHVREHTAPDAVFVVGKPRVFSLYTDRRAGVYHEPENPLELIGYMRSIGTRYVVTGMPESPRFDGWVRGDTEHFHLVYEAGGLGLFETRP
jgi:hypothetical protein